MSEEWRVVPGFELYEASNVGRIRRGVAGKSTKVGRILKPRNMKGYRVVSPRLISGGRTTTFVHRLVLAAFHGAPSEGQQGNHLNGIKHDNRIENLEWCTSAENVAHADRMGLRHWVKGSDHPMAKLSDSGVAEIRRRVGSERTKDLAAEFGVRPETVSRLVHRHSWRA